MSGTEALIIGSTLMSAAGSIRQGRDAQRQTEYSARARERDAAVAREQAEARARKTRRAGSARAAAARARPAGGGARLEGSPLDLLAQLSSDAELAALEDIHDGDIAAASQLTTARSNRMRGAAARRQSLFSAGSSLLRGASQANRK